MAYDLLIQSCCGTRHEKSSLEIESERVNACVRKHSKRSRMNAGHRDVQSCPNGHSAKMCFKLKIITNIIVAFLGLVILGNFRTYAQGKLL